MVGKKKFTFYLDENLIELLKEIAFKDFRSLNSEIEYILSKYIQDRE